MNLAIPQSCFLMFRTVIKRNIPGTALQIRTAVTTSAASASSGNKTTLNMANKELDEVQLKYMEEECILVDDRDRRTGSASKKTCHLLDNIKQGMLHRAFSVFLFNTQGKLLLQQRSDKKITFPGLLTNTCCSHPLHCSAETEEDSALGVRRAAQRKLHHELGIQSSQLPLEDFHYLTRIHYKAENQPKDNKWGEHEIDYILFIQRDVTVEHNPNEVQDYFYVDQKELKHLIGTSGASENGYTLTPWFKLIASSFLFQWWDNLQHLDSQKDWTTIHRMG